MSDRLSEMETLNICNLCSSIDIEYADRENGIGICSKCGYIFNRERPTLAAISEFYSKEDKYDQWIANEAERDALWQRRLKLLLNYKKEGALLDVGTGIGQFLHFAKRHFDVSGTEVSTTAIEIAKEKYGLEILHGTIEKLHFTKTFDVISLYHVLEHVSNPRTTVLSCHALLKPSGYLIIAVPNDVFGLYTWIVKLLSLFKFPGSADRGRMGLRRILLDGSQPEIHLSHFTVPVLRKFLEANGFEVVKSTLDQFYVESGWKKLVHYLIYRSCLWLNTFSGINIYFTMLVIARKKAP